MTQGVNPELEIKGRSAAQFRGIHTLLQDDAGAMKLGITLESL